MSLGQVMEKAFYHSRRSRGIQDHHGPLVYVFFLLQRMSTEVSDQLEQFKFQDYFPFPEMDEHPAALEPTEPIPVISQPEPTVLQELSSSSPQLLTVSVPSQQAQQACASQQSLAASPAMSPQVHAPLHLDAGTPTVGFKTR